MSLTNMKKYLLKKEKLGRGVKYDPYLCGVGNN